MDERITARVKARGLAAGFHRVGIASAGPLTDDFARYEDFVAAGYHGTMDWLAESPAVRRDVDHPGILDGAQSVIVCALSYHRSDSPEPLVGARIARYARGQDYHNFFRKRLRKLAAWLRSEFGAEARPMVDTAPVLERAWARRAGVGFVGKNGCIIAPGLGSYLLLGEVVTTLALVPDPPAEPRCGACTLCLDGCPTAAFPRPWVLDARRCVSYLTIEQPDAFPEALRAPVGDRVFGCDTCQDVCPFNRTAPPPPEGTRPFVDAGRWEGLTVADLLGLSEAEFAARAEGSPLARPGREGMARNAAVVLGNTGTRVHLPILQHAASYDPSVVVRESAAWALAAIARRAPPGD